MQNRIIEKSAKYFIVCIYYLEWPITVVFVFQLHDDNQELIDYPLLCIFHDTIQNYHINRLNIK